MCTRLVTVLFLALSLSAGAQAPSGYYNAAAGQSGTTLQATLHSIIKANHNDVGYTPGLWNAYYTTDKKPNSGNPGKLWTVYSDKPGQASPYEFVMGDQCSSSNPSSEGGCYNREHVWPRTYFGGQVPPMNSDLFIVYPTDYWVNSKRGNLPYGKVGTATWTSQNGTKVGGQTYSGAPSGTCFEPIDSFKGDLARSYFYVATRYLGDDASWQSWDMAVKAVLKPWAVQMLLEWHRLDPVSTKEQLRNNAVYALQKNRNPFIDSPQYVECIWGTANCAAVTPPPPPPPSSVANTAASESGLHWSLSGGALVLDWSGLSASSVQALALCDLQGRVLARQTAAGTSAAFPIGGYAPGLYLLQVRWASGAVRTEKLLLP